MVSQLTVIIKLVDHCNLACKYCYDGQFNPKKPGRFSEELLLKLIDDCFDVASKYIHFIWHGSEPLLYDIQSFKHALDYIKVKKTKHNLQVEHSIQTNGTLINLEWINLFKEYDFRVGVSYDGTPQLHDRYRVFRNGSPSSSIVLDRIKLLNKEGVGFGTLSVITKDSCDKAKLVFQGLVQAGIKWYDFCPNFATNPNGIGYVEGHITDQEYSRFMIDLFDAWIEYNDPKIYIRHLNNILETVLGGYPTICKLAGTCSDWFFTVTSLGDVYPCDSFAGDKNWYLGSIVTTDLGCIIDGHNYQTFREKHLKLKKQCVSCNWYRACNAGCTHERYIVDPSLNELYTCQANKNIFEHVYRYILSIR